MVEMNQFCSLLIEQVEVKKRLKEVTEMVRPFSKLLLANCINVDLGKAQRRYLESHLEDYKRIEAKLQELAKENEIFRKKLVERSADMTTVQQEARGIIKNLLPMEYQSERNLADRFETESHKVRLYIININKL